MSKLPFILKTKLSMIDKWIEKIVTADLNHTNEVEI